MLFKRWWNVHNYTSTQYTRKLQFFEKRKRKTKKMFFHAAQRLAISVQNCLGCQTDASHTSRYCGDDWKVQPLQDVNAIYKLYIFLERTDREHLFCVDYFLSLSVSLHLHCSQCFSCFCFQCSAYTSARVDFSKLKKWKKYQIQRNRTWVQTIILM